MKIVNFKEISKLSIKEIDELIAQLEQGYTSLLWHQDDINKTLKLGTIIGKLIDLRCKKAGIVIPKHLR